MLAPIRVSGIAGAYAGYAEGLEGMVANAAAPALREPFSVDVDEVDISASVSLPITTFKSNDFDNSGQRDFAYSSFVYGTAGVIARFGAFGVGGNAELKRYTLTGTDGETEHVLIGKYHALSAVRIVGDEVTVGAGARVVTVGIDSTSPATGALAAFTIAGLSPEFGALVRPDDASFRVGATYRFAVDAGSVTGDARSVDDRGVERLGRLVVPDHVVLPWELEVGTAIELGSKPLNPRWIDPEERRRRIAERVRARRAADPDASADDVDEAAQIARELKREMDERKGGVLREATDHLLVTGELFVTGPVQNGVSVLRFLGQNQPESAGVRSVIGSSGASVNFSPRFGIETEPVPGRLRTRFGSYYEPKRFASWGSVPGSDANSAVGRQHFTFGSDVRIFALPWFGRDTPMTYKIQASVDIAPRYQSASVGLGVWH